MQCPECGCKQLIRDGATGEVVCAECGLVMSGAEHVAPFVSKRYSSVFDYASFSRSTGKLPPAEVRRLGEKGRFLCMVGRLEGGERTELVLVLRISMLAGWLCLPGYVAENAMYFGKRLLNAMRLAGRRLTVDRVAAVAVWYACKVHGLPRTMKEFEGVLREKGWRTGSLYSLLVKASALYPPPKASVNPTEHVGKLTANLERFARRDYLSHLEGCAITLLKGSGVDFAGKDPVCVVATAICVADELLGSWIGRNAICKALGAGYNAELADALKANATPPALINSSSELVEKHVMEVIVYEDVRNAAH